MTASFSRMAGESVSGSPYIISATLSPANVLSNYNITYNTSQFTITPASLNITATAGKFMVYGSAAPELTYTYTGLVNGDLNATFSGGLETSVASSSSVGGYLITQGNLVSTGNYTIGTFNPAALTVKPGPLTITADDDSKTYGTLKSFIGTAFTERPGDGQRRLHHRRDRDQHRAPVWAPVGSDPIVPAAQRAMG